VHLVFIGGPQRSGTTLVQTLVVNALGSTALLPEAHVVHGLLEVYRRGMAEWPKTARLFGREEVFRGFVNDSIQGVLNTIVQVNGAVDFLVLKDPNFGMVAPQILDLFPEATCVFCIRDPRDIASSFLKIEQREKAMGRERKRYRNRNLFLYCTKVKRSCQEAVKAGFSWTVLRYEDVVADPAGQLERLGAETGLPLRVPDFDNMRWIEAEVRHKDSWVSSLEEKAPSVQSVGAFRGVLSPGEIAYVEVTCGGIMKKFGYSPVSPTYRRKPPFSWLDRLVIMARLRKYVVSEISRQG